jgi:hypothetical protein
VSPSFQRAPTIGRQMCSSKSSRAMNASPATSKRRETPFARLNKSIRPTQWPPNARLCVTGILALDPTQRGLGSRERFRRSQAILQDVMAQLAACTSSESSLPAPSKDAIAAARASLARKRVPALLSDAAEANSALAEKLATAKRFVRSAARRRSDAGRSCPY